MTSTADRSLAQPQHTEWSLAELGRKIDMAKASGWGLRDASGAQLNMLAIYCQKHQLLPVDEVTLYEGNPFITVLGHVTMMRRNHRGDYRGFSQRPLSAREKEDWGYDADDLVVETTIRSAAMGEVRGYGKVSADERSGKAQAGHRINPVARFNPVEMAQKRSLVRAKNMAYGLDSGIEEDFDAVQTVIEERNDPVVVQRDAAEYARIFGTEDDSVYDISQRAAPSSPPASARSGRATSDQPADVASPEPLLVTRASDPLWRRWLAAEKAARAADLDIDTSFVKLGEVSEAELRDDIEHLEGLIAEAQAQT